MQYAYSPFYIQSAERFARELQAIGPASSQAGEMQGNRNWSGAQLEAMSDIEGKAVFRSISGSANSLVAACEDAAALESSNNPKKQLKAQLRVVMKLGDVVMKIKDHQDVMAWTSVPASPGLTDYDRKLFDVVHEHTELLQKSSRMLDSARDDAIARSFSGKLAAALLALGIAGTGAGALKAMPLATYGSAPTGMALGAAAYLQERQRRLAQIEQLSEDPEGRKQRFLERLARENDPPAPPGTRNI